MPTFSGQLYKISQKIYYAVNFKVSLKFTWKNKQMRLTRKHFQRENEERLLSSEQWFNVALIHEYEVQLV